MALDKLVSAQAQRAIAEADALLFVVDATVGPTEAGCRRGSPAVAFGFARCHGGQQGRHEARETDIWEFASLGFSQPWPVSALHGRGTGDMLDALVAALPPPAAGRGLWRA